jgi:proteasome alpha subunit
MPEIFPEYMGYDRTIAVFSPDGRLFQVEYAKEASKKGTTAIGMTYKDGIIIAAAKVFDELQIPETLEKIFKIEDHIVGTASGLIADARYLFQRARIRAQNYRITYDEEIDVIEIVKDVADHMQMFTMYGGLRPFGVVIMIGGVDKTGKHLFEIDPSGMYFEWKAYAIGRFSEQILKALKQKYKENMELEKALSLAIDLLRKFEKDAKIEVVYVDKEKKFVKLSEKEIESL